MNKPFFRANIPLHSTFTAKVSGSGDADADAFVASGLFEPPSGAPIAWTDAQLKAGVTVTLDQPGAYSGKIDLAFARESTARIQMQVIKPDGTKFVYDQSLTQGPGLDRTFILLVTRKS
jgi:hypothetical protein